MAESSFFSSLILLPLHYSLKFIFPGCLYFTLIFDFLLTYVVCGYYFFLLNKIILFYVSILPECVYVHHKPDWWPQIQKRLLGLLELELGMIVSHQVGAGY